MFCTLILIPLGLVSPVKNQGLCNASAAFATMALVETCFKNITGQFENYSEQEGHHKSELWFLIGYIWQTLLLEIFCIKLHTWQNYWTF